MTPTVPMLPELPQAMLLKGFALSHQDALTQNYYTADQMRAYALEALRRRSVVTDEMVEAMRQSLWGSWGKNRQTTDWPEWHELYDALTAALEAQKG
jgi:hypothetical protein